MQRFKNRNLLISAGADGLGLVIAKRVPSRHDNTLKPEKTGRTKFIFQAGIVRAMPLEENRVGK